METLYDAIIRNSKIHPSRVFNVYLFGSRIYKSFNSDSDWDVIMVANNSVEHKEILSENFNIHIFTPDKFKKDLEWHKLTSLESVFAPRQAVIHETIDYSTFKIDKNKLRHSVLYTSQASWIKCKNKLEKSQDYKSAMKSLFHCIRVLLFGIQIVNTGKIYDFSQSNWILSKIKSKQWTWSEIESEFEPIKRNMEIEFKKIIKK